jgi:hypothetical protein
MEAHVVQKFEVHLLQMELGRVKSQPGTSCELQPTLMLASTIVTCQRQQAKAKAKHGINTY